MRWRALVALMSALGAAGASGCGEDAGTTSAADREVGSPSTDGGLGDGGDDVLDHGGPDARATDSGRSDAAARDLGRADAGPADASDGSAPDADSPPDAGRPPAPFGAACVQDVECAGGRCLQLGPLGRGRCGDPCPTGQCPPGGRCVVDPVGAPVCIPVELCADFDGDTYGDGDACAGPDCDDADPARHPGAAERCDGRDDDCDGTVDESAEDADVPCQTGRPGVCAPGWSLCALGALTCVATAEPSEETCNGLDDDCDAQLDEALFEPCGSEVGACEPGRRSCVDGAFGAAWGRWAHSWRPATDATTTATAWWTTSPSSARDASPRPTGPKRPAEPASPSTPKGARSSPTHRGG